MENRSSSIVEGGELAEKNNLPEYISMYDIPGQDNITEHAFERYKNDKEQDQEIKKLANDSVAIYRKELRSAPRNALPVLIRNGLENQDLEIQKAAAVMIFFGTVDSHDDLEKRVSKLIKTGLDNDDIKTQYAYAEMSIFAANDDRDYFEKKVTELIDAGLKNEDAKVQIAYAKMLEYASLEKRADLILTGLNKKDAKVQNAYCQMLEYAPVNEYDRLQEKVYQLVKTGLESNDIAIQKSYAEMIYFVRDGLQPSLEEKVYGLVKTGLDSSDINIQKTYVEMIRYTPKNTKNELFKLALEKLGDQLFEPPLYRHKEIYEDKFHREKFAKTGSETTLLGGQLKDKTIVRQINPKAFLAWQKLYEDHKMWKNENFDYVPIEPIQSYRLNKKGLVDVYSGVLDLSLGVWEGINSDFSQELDAEKNKIISILIKQKVEHGHAHDANFCLKFFRDINGRVDFSRKPRLYLIDFDQARSY